MAIRGVILDIDGTLLTSEHVMPDRVRHAVEDISRRLPVLLATGRRWAEADGIAAMLPTCPRVAVLNGAMGINTVTKQIIWRHRVPPEAVALGREYGSKCGLDVFVCTDRVGEPDLYYEREPQTSGGQDFWHRASVYGGGGQASDQDFGRALALHLRGPEELMQQARDLLKPLVGEQATLRYWQDHVAGMWVLALMAPGVTKGDTALRWAHELGIASSDILAIGDDLNDLEMVSVVGHGVAMGNGNPRLKEVASMVAPTNDQEGVFWVFRQLGLVPDFVGDGGAAGASA